eukprot:11324500-Prorocentrum_lima.AAC.1
MAELSLETAAFTSKARDAVPIAISLIGVRAASCDSDAAEVGVAALCARDAADNALEDIREL